MQVITDPTQLNRLLKSNLCSERRLGHGVAPQLVLERPNNSIDPHLGHIGGVKG